MIDPIAVGACVLMVGLSLAFLILRRLVQPAAVAPVTGWCWAERRATQQARTGMADELVCGSCGHIIPGGGR